MNNCPPYVLRKIGTPNTPPGVFGLTTYKGKNPISNQENGYCINDGICFSTFSYNSGSYVPIQNMNTALSLGKNYAVYIEFGIGGAYPQITGATVKATPVGQAAQSNFPDAWVDYPDFYNIIACLANVF